MEYKTKAEALEELKKVNNNLTYLMRQKRALQGFIKSEEVDPKTRAFQLRNDEKFIEEYGRKRNALEISLIMHYSERQIYRFLKEEE